jgi:hypothetical protein
VKYASNGAYLLGPRAIQVLGKISIYLEDIFKVERYEDLAVGKIMHHYGFEPFQFDLEEKGILYPR